MVRFSNFELMWFLFFLIPLSLSLYDSRLFIIVIVFLGLESWRLWSHIKGAEWVPSPSSIVEKMLKVANVTSRDVVYDLGSGDGRIVLKAGKIGANAIGIEIDPIRVLMSRLMIKFTKIKNAKIVHGNFFTCDIRDATVVTLFQLPRTMEKLENKLRKELKKGSRIVSYRFVFKNWKPAKVDSENKIFLYKI